MAVGTALIRGNVRSALVQPVRRKPVDINSNRTLRRRFWAETATAAVTGILCAITPIWPDWIEGISGWDPDQHNGSVEWMIVAGLLLITVVMVALAARSWRRIRVADAS
jgi:hypothetical protein